MLTCMRPTRQEKVDQIMIRYNIIFNTFKLYFIINYTIFFLWQLLALEYRLCTPTRASIKSKCVNWFSCIGTLLHGMHFSTLL